MLQSSNRARLHKLVLNSPHKLSRYLAFEWPNDTYDLLTSRNLKLSEALSTKNSRSWASETSTIIIREAYMEPKLGKIQSTGMLSSSDQTAEMSARIPPLPTINPHTCRIKCWALQYLIHQCRGSNEQVHSYFLTWNTRIGLSPLQLTKTSYKHRVPRQRSLSPKITIFKTT